MTETVKQAHPIRGVLWGLMFGIGLTLVLVVTTIISLDLVTMIVVTLLATIIGVVWSIYGPARAPDGPPPSTARASAPEATRFDDDAYGADTGDEPETPPTANEDEPPAEERAE